MVLKTTSHTPILKNNSYTMSFTRFSKTKRTTMPREGLWGFIPKHGEETQSKNHDIQP
ncbi:hypothetical protein Lalb_Chr06g0176241 [Lupinus albus]|uniref:Uncharacterized protein n=1 Tax=Lupinus albus TaxID=3870 RepID=A0A6A4QF73_LUPAL|nr:hypothetical protein Lalb_Chr06g0176241 [Lupinus albus]